MGDRTRSPETPEWELFDLNKDPNEMVSVYDDPDYAGFIPELKQQLANEMAKVGDTPYDHPLCQLPQANPTVTH